jgi:hypothetical protein
MRILSKSKLMAFRQCARRFWLEIHRPELRADSAAAEATFSTGYQVGDLAQKLYDPVGQGTLIEPFSEGFEQALVRTRNLLQERRPIFEASFRIDGVLSLADVMLPVGRGAQRGWRMVEVKSATSVKDYHRDDIAIQTYVARTSGVPLVSVALAYIDKDWVYPGNGDYAGLLKEEDLTEETFARAEEVLDWISLAQTFAAKRKEPEMATGSHCGDPYECGFFNYCQSREPQAEQPISWMPGRLGRNLHEQIALHGWRELRDLPDALLTDRQLRVKRASLSGRAFFDEAGAAQALAGHKLPAYFIDFETIQFGVPIWKGTRPYQQIPFQFSVHRLSRTGKLEHEAFLDLSGGDPSLPFAKALIGACGERGPIFVYNAAFETARIRELAQRFPRLSEALLALNARVVDLLPVAREHYYHPSQAGSWSIKAVLPALVPELSYGDLDGVQDGGMAMDAFLEALSPEVAPARKQEIERQLLSYCALDTYAMVRLWARFSGSSLAV